MNENGFSLSDIAAVTKDVDGFGGSGGAWWIIIFLIFAMGGGGLWGNRGGDFGQYATAASQTEILLGQQFQNLDNKIDRIGNGIADLGYANQALVNNAQTVLGGTIVSEGRALQAQISECCCDNQKNVDSLRFDMANYAAQTNATVTAQTQRILDAMCESKMAEMQSRINQLETANVINAATAGVVKYPMATTYTSGANPFCSCGCNI